MGATYEYEYACQERQGPSTYNPRPNDLPENARPPFPASTQVDNLFLESVAANRRARDTVRRVVLEASEPHADSKKHLLSFINVEGDRRVGERT